MLFLSLVENLYIFWLPKHTFVHQLLGPRLRVGPFSSLFGFTLFNGIEIRTVSPSSKKQQDKRIKWELSMRRVHVTGLLSRQAASETTLDCRCGSKQSVISGDFNKDINYTRLFYEN